MSAFRLEADTPLCPEAVGLVPIADDISYQKGRQFSLFSHSSNPVWSDADSDMT
jgi:hypothetical protein